MPLYDYECEACGARFERLVTSADADAQACARCGTERARRLLPVIAGLGGRAPEPGCGGGACGACS